MVSQPRPSMFAILHGNCGIFQTRSFSPSVKRASSAVPRPSAALADQSFALGLALPIMAALSGRDAQVGCNWCRTPRTYAQANGTLKRPAALSPVPVSVSRRRTAPNRPAEAPARRGYSAPRRPAGQASRCQAPHLDLSRFLVQSDGRAMFRPNLYWTENRRPNA